MVKFVDEDIFMKHFVDNGIEFILPRSGKILLPAYRNGRIMVDYLAAGFRYYYPEAYAKYTEYVKRGYYNYGRTYIQNLLTYQEDEHVIIAPIMSRGESNRFQEIDDLIICIENILKEDTVLLPLFELTFFNKTEVLNQLTEYFNSKATAYTLAIFNNQEKYLKCYETSDLNKISNHMNNKLKLYNANGEVDNDILD